jgi:hypothetical protein
MKTESITQITDQANIVISHMQKLHQLKFKSMKSSGTKAEHAYECTVAILLGCILDIDPSLSEIWISLNLRSRLYNLKEEIERAPKDGVGLGNKRI